MPERIRESDSTALYFVKAMAIFASVAAHVSLIDTTTPLSGYVTRFWDMFSCISVGNFLIAAGILYTRTPGDTGAFWKWKFQSMMIPWLFCGSLTYAYGVLNGQPGSLAGYGNWLLGNGSWLYYVTLHLLMLALFKPFWKSVPVLVGCVALNALQLLHPFVPNPFGNEYLNPANWIGFFALGILLRRQGLRFSRGFMAGAAAMLLVSGSIVYHRWIYSYFHILNALYSVSAFFVLFALGAEAGGDPAGKAHPAHWQRHLLHLSAAYVRPAAHFPAPSPAPAENPPLPGAGHGHHAPAHSPGKMDHRQTPLRR